MSLLFFFLFVVFLLLVCRASSPISRAIIVQVPILDPQIHIKEGYAPYDEGIKEDVFVKDITGGNYVAQVG